MLEIRKCHLYSKNCFSRYRFFRKSGIWKSNFWSIETFRYLNVKFSACRYHNGIFYMNFIGIDTTMVYLFHRQDLRKYISQLYFLQSTGRRGTFLSEEQICNCAVVPSHNANGIKVKYLLNLPEINIGANLQIFL